MNESQSIQYVFITYDAISEFSSGRYYQSAEFSESVILCNLLSGKSVKWNHSVIKMRKNDKGGLIFYTRKFDNKRGIIFDYSTFMAFLKSSDNDIITIFQKVIKFAVRYFEGLPYVGCEHIVESKTAIVYPFPFVATREVKKVIIDLNSSKQNRKNQDYLTVYDFCSVEKNRQKVSFASLNKAVAELGSMELDKSTNEMYDDIPSYQVTELERLDLSLDAQLGLEKWKTYLTSKQKDFVCKEVCGAERLEGAAGSGKTLSMILRCIYLMEYYDKKEQEYHIVFIAHSTSTRDSIRNVFISNCKDFAKYEETKDERPYVSLLITTLHEWSAANLGTNSISDSEYIDKDASQSKSYQQLYIEEAFSAIKLTLWNSYKKMCSQELTEYIENKPIQQIVELLQYEISVIIKGKANGDLDKYKVINRPLLTLPLQTEWDRKFIFSVYNKYQDNLEKIGQFDTDDITLSALGQMDTPIWKRRSIKEGYDACFIDETQLFNLNELSVFHLLNKPERKNCIIYSIDKSQSNGQLGFSDDELSAMFLDDISSSSTTTMTTIFRSSPDIINLAFNILSANASIFTALENPLDHCISAFTRDEEKKCTKPVLTLCTDDDEIVVNAMNHADAYAKTKNIPHSKILLVATTEELLDRLMKYASSKNKPFEVLKSRNDNATLKLAQLASKYVFSGIDYVGGLEFDVTFILGVDKYRVPPMYANESSHFLLYAWHNKMYIAVTRAKYYVEIFADSSAGISPTLESAKELDLIDVKEC